MADDKPILAWAGRTSEEVAPAPFRMGGREIAALIGWGGLEVRDPGVDLLALCAVHARAVSDFSCGQCIPCREGSRVLARLVEELRVDPGSGDASARMRQIRLVAETMEKTSRCDVGKTSPSVIVSIMDRLGWCAPGPGAQESAPHGRSAPPEDDGPFVYESLLTAPCIQACPLHVDIPRYLEQIRNGRFREALETIQERLPIAGVVGRVCVKPCESHCRMGLLDGPIRIRHLKRFVADHERGLGRPAPGSRAAAPAAGSGRVAIVGAGPAGLTCARVLAARGHEVTILEKLLEPGGMMAVGIPSYRLPHDVLAEEAKAIEDVGVKIVYGKALGSDFSVADLKAQGFRSVFIAVGAHKSAKLRLRGDDEGRRAGGVLDCLDFLARARQGEQVPLGKKVLVLGGGNVAIDVARTAKRMGVGDVRIVYRRKREQIRAHKWEVDEAVQEGAAIEETWVPDEILVEGGKLKGLHVKRSQFADPASLGPEFHVFEADAIVFAVGTSIDESFQKGVEGLELMPDGTVKADPLTFQTSVEGVFAGGDCVSGPEFVVLACAHGRRAGLQIAHYLATGRVEPLGEALDEELLGQIEIYDPGETIALPHGRPPMTIRQEPPLERTRDFREVDAGFSAEEAMAEASRCLRCYRVVTWAYRGPELLECPTPARDDSPGDLAVHEVGRSSRETAAEQADAAHDLELDPREPAPEAGFEISEAVASVVDDAHAVAEGQERSRQGVQLDTHAQDGRAEQDATGVEQGQEMVEGDRLRRKCPG